MNLLKLVKQNIRSQWHFLPLVAMLTVLILPAIAFAQTTKVSAGTAKTTGTLPSQAKREVATFAGGCFWAMQSEFKQLRGVDRVVAGYAGGSVPKPSYEQVCTGTTGHAESIQIVFDPKIISYTDLVRIFLTDIDPTTLNRQGPDEGTQYRSAVFYHDAAQRDATKKVIQELTTKKVYKDPIVTEVVPYKNFYAAEGYHQDYFLHNPTQPYCAAVVAPEVKRFQKLNQSRLKP